MGIDFYLINETDKEYIWTGRPNPLYNNKHDRVKVTQKNLDKGLSEAIIELTSCFYNYENLPLIFKRYRKLKKYIKSKEVYCVSDASGDFDWLHLENAYTNNIKVEDNIYENNLEITKMHIMEGFK